MRLHRGTWWHIALAVGVSALGVWGAFEHEAAIVGGAGLVLVGMNLWLLGEPWRP